MTLAAKNLDPDLNIGAVLPLTGWRLHLLICNSRLTWKLMIIVQAPGRRLGVAGRWLVEDLRRRVAAPG